MHEIYCKDLLQETWILQPVNPTRTHQFELSRELLPLLTSRVLSLITRGRIYSTYIRPVLLYASECWAPTVENVNKLQRNDRAMIRWICNVRLKDRVKLRITDIKSAVRYNRLRWYGHVQQDKECIKHVANMVVEGRRTRGRPKKNWANTVQHDM